MVNKKFENYYRNLRIWVPNLAILVHREIHRCGFLLNLGFSKNLIHIVS